MAYRGKVITYFHKYSLKRYSSSSKSIQISNLGSKNSENLQTQVNKNDSCDNNITEEKRDSKWKQPSGFKTPIEIYNPITKTIVPFYTKHSGYVKWYMCGPTVYDSPHIGHASCYVRMDIIRRILEDYFKINCIVAMGITNIDDKIIKAAHDKKEDFRKIAQKYEQEFLDSMKLLEVKPPTIYTRVTEFIPNIQLFIQKLIDKGMAVIDNDGDIVFATSKHNGYGKLVPLTEEQKNSEFTLWKKAKRGEPCYETPWSVSNRKLKGRPGWHIECSAMASHIFGQDLDIHSGGMDLKFPHHENEEAQSCAYHDVNQWVNYWIHAGHLTLRSTKMSKSLRNTISIPQLLRQFTPNQFRFYCLMTKYRNELDYTPESLQASNSVLEYFRTFVSTCNNYIQGCMHVADIDETALYSQIELSKNQIHDALCHDFDTVSTIKILQNLALYTNSMLIKKIETPLAPRSIGPVAAVSQFIQNNLNVFGVAISTKLETDLESEDHIYRPDLNQILDSALTFRDHVRLSALGKFKSSNLKNPSPTLLLLEICDAFRDNLKNSGIYIKDNEMKSSWHVVNPKNKKEEKL